VVLIGTASIDGRAPRGLELRVGDEVHPVDAVGMPRFDASPRRSGFWAVVPVRAQGGEVAVSARLCGADGTWYERPLGAIAVLAPATAGAADAPGGTIAVLLATYNPDLDLLAAQIASLRAQTDTGWVCLISDDCSAPDSYAEVCALVAGDPRFTVSRAEAPLGFYRNFERLLGLAPASAGLLALCDQDDVWHPDKLATLRAAIGGAGLVYCDMRLVDAGGRVLRDTMWEGRANNATSLASMLIAGTVTGAATMLTPRVAARALPFPDSPGIEFHDHWLSLVALALGEVRYVPRALQDYVQHPAAVLGSQSGRVYADRRGATLRPRELRAAYFLGYLPVRVRALTLLARCGDELSPAKRRALERHLDCEHRLGALLWLLARPLRALGGRTETLGSEWEIALGVIWRRLAGWVARRPGWPDRLLLDCRFPDPPIWRQRRLQRWRSRF
jgi:hypothetical protein